MNAVPFPLGAPRAHAHAEYRAAGRDSLAELVERHTALVSRLAHHLCARLPANVDVGDLVQAGMIGLIEASRSYDAAQGASFETYASIRIRGAMLDEVRKGDWMPRSVHRRAREAAQAVRAIEQRTGRAAAPADVARALGMSREDYDHLLEDAVRGQVLSLDMHVEEHGDARLPALQADASPSGRYESAKFSAALAEAIGGLPEREALVLSLYYEQELNLREIGATLGVSESRVCQIHGQALLRVRSRLAGWIDDTACA